MEEHNHKYHNLSLNSFADGYYTGMVGKQHVIEEMVLDDTVFWLAIRDGTKYLIPREIIDKLPIKVVDTTEIHNAKKVYYVVNVFQTINFKKEQNHTFRELVDDFAGFKHSNPTHYKLYKILCLTAHLDRVNFRVATNAGFGKDSVWEALHLLKRDVAVINPRSMPALEYRLFNKVLVLNELSNLESSQRDLVQEFLLLCGDMRTTYEKSTRATTKTRDLYNIKSLSLVCMFNTYDYYKDIGKDDKFFDNIFTHAVTDRFVPFKFEGRLDGSQFKLVEPIQKTLDRNRGDYIKTLRSLEYYKASWRDNLHKYKEQNFSESMSQRHKPIFGKLCSFIDLYSNTQEEYDSLTSELYSCYKAYNKMIEDEKSGWGV